MNNNSKNGKRVTIFALLLSLISVGILVFGFSMVSSDRVVVLQSISNLYNKVTKMPTIEKDFLNKISSSKDIEIKSKLDIVAGEEKINILTDLIENKEDKKASISLNAKYNEEELIDLVFAFAENKVYGFIKDVTPNYYYQSFDFISIINSLSADEYDKVGAYIKDAITDAIDKEDITKEKATITYKGKDKKVNKLTYKITEKELGEITESFLKSLKSNKKLISKMAEISKISEADFTKLIDDILNSTKDITTNEEIIYYNVYYYGFNKIVEYELYDPKTKTSLQYKTEDKTYLNMYEDGKALFELVISKDKNDYTYTLDLYNKETNKKYTIEGTYSNNRLVAETTIEGATLRLVIDNKLTKEENNYVLNSSIKVSTEVLGFEVEMININSKIEFIFNSKVELDLSNSKDANDITEEEQNTIMENLENNKLYQLLEGLFEEYSPLIEEQLSQYITIEELEEE